MFLEPRDAGMAPVRRLSSIEIRLSHEDESAKESGMLPEKSLPSRTISFSKGNAPKSGSGPDSFQPDRTCRARARENFSKRTRENRLSGSVPLRMMLSSRTVAHCQRPSQGKEPSHQTYQASAWPSFLRV